MADATQELMLRVRGDNSGADKAIAQTTKSLNRLKVSGEKANGAFRNFSRSLSEAKTGADVAAGAAESLANIVGKSLAGAVAVGAVKLFTDQINKMGESVKESSVAASKAFADIENAGAAMSLAEAQSQVKGLEANISAIQIKLDELNKSPFQNFIAKATGTKKSLEELQSSQERLRDTEIAAGMMSQNISEIKLNGLDEEGKALEKINQEYRDRDKIASRMTTGPAQAQYQSESGDKFARDRNAELDKQAKARAELQIKFSNKVYDEEQKLANQAEAREKKTEQERVQRKIENNNRIYRQDKYDLDEKIKMESDADDKKFKRELRNAYRAREQQKRTSQTSSDTSGGVLGATKAGQGALDTARKQRAQQLKQENYKTAQGVAPTQRDKEKLAAQQAAREMPSLAEQIQGGVSGVDPAQLAAMGAVNKFEKDRAFGPAKMSGITQGKLGEEKKNKSTDLLEAIQALVDLMGSGVLVK